MLNSFVFFIAQVGTQRSISIEKDLCVRNLSELITFHRKLVELPRDQLKKVIPETQEAKKARDRTFNIYLYLVKKSERQMIGLLRRHVERLTSSELAMLSDKAEHAPVFKLRVLLWQLQGNFEKCLTMFF